MSSIFHIICQEIFFEFYFHQFSFLYQFHYDKDSKLVGGRVVYQLLEINRVCNVTPYESNFHIFYSLLMGAPDNLLVNLRLDKTKSYTVSIQILTILVHQKVW